MDHVTEPRLAAARAYCNRAFKTAQAGRCEEACDYARAAIAKLEKFIVAYTDTEGPAASGQKG